MTDPQQN